MFIFVLRVTLVVVAWFVGFKLEVTLVLVESEVNVLIFPQLYSQNSLFLLIELGLNFIL